MTLGQRIQKIRKEKGFSQEQIAETLGVSRQAVNDNLSRTEALLRRMEENIGCVKRYMESREALRVILEAAAVLDASSDPAVASLGKQIRNAASTLKE